MGSEKPHQLRSVGELVFMAPPTLACDGPREDSIEFVPALFVVITNERLFINKWLDRTLPLFQHLRGSGTAIEYRKDSRLGAPRRPELSSWARCTAAGPRGRGLRRPCPGCAGGLRRCTALEYRKKSHGRGSAAKEEPRREPAGRATPESGSSIVCPGAPPCTALAVPQPPDSGGALPRARRLNTEREASGHRGGWS